MTGPTTEGCEDGGEHVGGAPAGAVLRRGGVAGGDGDPARVPGAPPPVAVLAPHVARHERRPPRQEALPPRTR